MGNWKLVLTVEDFKRLARKYLSGTGFGLVLFSAKKVGLNYCQYYPWDDARQRLVDPNQMIRESLRWGEPNISLDNRGFFLWCVPIFLNNRITGGIFSATRPDSILAERGEKISRAAWKLLELACKRNICNTSLMRLNRQHGRTNAEKADAIHSVKQHLSRFLYQDPREIYLQEELGLLSAIRKGQKEKARQIINRILIRIYSLGREDLDMLKTLVLEMVVLMYRTAVDRGADPREMLGVNSSYLKTFHEIKDDIDLSNWLTRWLETFISTGLQNVGPTPPENIALAIEYMKNNLNEPLTRDEAARSCNMSPGHFSKIFREKTGHTFTDLLNLFRVEQASDLLDNSGLSVYEIAFRTGFNDQSYFSKVFKKYRQMTPKNYRKHQA